MPGEATVEIAFDRGTPVALNGVPMPLAELVESVSVIAGHQGIGRIECERIDKSGARLHVVHDAPAAVTLHAACVHGGGET
jgi:argininosuccinate synthase